MFQLRKMVPDATDPIQHLVSPWGTDPDSLGAYSCDLIGKPTDQYESPCDPVDNQYFAGEAASADHSRSVTARDEGGLTEAMVPLQISRM
ncbi:polyamine oxidase 5-like [Zingiber officinale]|uniref:polyamine oxidase 5-like n=1 Tax=Zingiber officinale TaxID=94328 RepID=UPI001C4BF126|nr:polyamine oxidase 5-like [Zingiber officinale]